MNNATLKLNNNYAITPFIDHRTILCQWISK